MRVLAEVLFARIAGPDLRFQVARVDLERSRRDPDTSVREFVNARLGEPDAPRVVHSTSWRYERDRIVLSYLVYSDGLAPRGPSRRARLDALPSPENSARDARDPIARSLRMRSATSRSWSRRIRRSIGRSSAPRPGGRSASSHLPRRDEFVTGATIAIDAHGTSALSYS